MINTILDLLLIQFIIVGIIDVSGFVQELEGFLSKWLHIRARIPKPFSCSLCTTWWTGLIYLIITGNLTLPLVAFTLFISLLTTVTKDIIYLIQDLLIKIIDIISKMIS